MTAGECTIADNGRGIPVQVLTHGAAPNVQTVMTDLQRPSLSAPYFAPGGEKGIGVAGIYALSTRLSVEVRRDGTIYRQE